MENGAFVRSGKGRVQSGRDLRQKLDSSRFRSQEQRQHGIPPVLDRGRVGEGEGSRPAECSGGGLDLCLEPGVVIEDEPQDDRDGEDADEDESRPHGVPAHPLDGSLDAAAPPHGDGLSPRKGTEVGRHLGRRAVSPRGVVVERLEDDRLEVPRNGTVRPSWRIDRPILHDFGEDLLSVLVCPSAVQCQQLVQHETGAIDVRPLVSLSTEALGSQVARACRRCLQAR